MLHKAFRIVYRALSYLNVIFIEGNDSCFGAIEIVLQRRTMGKGISGCNLLKPKGEGVSPSKQSYEESYVVFDEFLDVFFFGGSQADKP